MIKTIYELGKKYLEESNRSFLDALTLPIEHSKSNTQYAVIINLSTEDKKIYFELKEMESSTPMELRWIGIADGSNSLQWNGTVRTQNLGFLMSQTIPNLLKRWSQNDPYYQKLQTAFEIFFKELQITKSNEERYRYIINPIYYNGQISQKEPKKVVAEVTKQFQSFIENVAHVKVRETALYSLAIDGELMVKQDEYERLVEEEKTSVFEGAKMGKCAITNEECLVTADTTKLKFKYYITDKTNFASGFHKKNFHKNLALGKEAYQYLQAGETYVLRNFDTRFSNLPCYIIPELLYDAPFSDVPMDQISGRIKKLVRTVKTIETTELLDELMENYLEYEDQDNLITLHFLFYTKSQAALKINKLLNDVPLSHIKKLGLEMRKISNLGKKFFPNEKINLGLDNMYYLLPMRINKQEVVDKRKIFQLYESLLTNKKLSYHWLISQFVLLGRVHMFANYRMYQYHYHSRMNENWNDMNLVHAIMYTQLVIKLLKTLDLLEGGNEVESYSYELPDQELAEYMETMHFSIPQSSLFLLGYLIARIGAAQVNKSRTQSSSENQPSSAKTSNKPILSKINFRAMNKQKIMMLSNDVFEKMKQLEINNLTNEAIYGEHRNLLDMALRDHWPLTDYEGVYYILSGYAYGTKRIFQQVRNQ